MKIKPVENYRFPNTLKPNNQNTKKDNFKGGIGDFAFDMLDKGFAFLDRNAMIQVSFVDTVSTNIPRTLVDLKTGLAAALETCRREFSGLFVNCLMPGLIVRSIAELAPKADELRGLNAAGSWATGDSINKFKSVYKQAQESGAADKTKDFVERTLSSLEGLDGKTWVKYADKASDPMYKEAVENITTAIGKRGKERKILLNQAQTKLAKLTKAESVLKFNGTPQSNLRETLRDVTDLGSKFNAVRDKALASTEAAVPADKAVKVNEAIDKFGSSLGKFVNGKSIAGLIIVIAIAVSVQRINRSITRKQFNAEGAPIYKDFGKKDTTQKMDEKQKKAFGVKKMVAAAGMYGLAALSMMKKPSMGMFQFSGIFPTLDQCRWIASSTFASRMLAAEDENELRETTVRDLASFSGLYFLGDYVKKGVASGIEKFSKSKAGAKLIGENVVLLNRKKEVAKPVIQEGASLLEKLTQNAGYRAKQFGNWIKNTDLKAASEVSSVKVRNLRNLCRVADIAFSIIMLGVLLPRYNRSVTEKKVAAAKLREEEQKKAMLDFSTLQQKDVPGIFKGLVKNS